MSRTQGHRDPKRICRLTRHPRPIDSKWCRAASTSTRGEQNRALHPREVIGARLARDPRQKRSQRAQAEGPGQRSRGWRPGYLQSSGAAEFGSLQGGPRKRLAIIVPGRGLVVDPDGCSTACFPFAGRTSCWRQRHPVSGRCAAASFRASTSAGPEFLRSRPRSAWHGSRCRTCR